MSLVYVYALVDSPIALEMTGVMGEQMALIPAAIGWLVVGEPSVPVPAASAETLRAQDRVVRALTARADAVLPMRFGTCFENETALQNRMAHFTAENLRAALARVRGSEQMTLRVFSTDVPMTAPTTTPPRTGTAYLKQRAATLASSLPDLLDPLRRALTDIIRDEIVDATKRPPLIGTAYHLIPRGDASRYHDALAGASTPETVTIRATGPSPAYAFAKDALR